MENQETTEILSILIDRLYVLRNQIMHGASTWQGKVNRQQVVDGDRFMKSLIPSLMEIMLVSKGSDWGESYYPVQPP